MSFGLRQPDRARHGKMDRRKFCGIGANLRDIKLQGVSDSLPLLSAQLDGADFSYARLRNVKLDDAELNGVVFQEATLEGVSFKGAKLRGANLVEAKFENCVLSEAEMELAYIDKTRFENTRLHRELFGDESMRRASIGEEKDAKGEPDVRDYEKAKNGYLTLKQNFEHFGDYAAASWAYRKERRMETAQSYYQNPAKFISNKVMEWLCDYGEGLWRVVVTLTLVMVGFALIYALMGGYLRDGHLLGIFCGEEPVRDLLRVGIFSLAGMTARHTSNLEHKSELIKALADSEWVQLLAAMETVMAIALAGLLGFVLGNRIRRS